MGCAARGNKTINLCYDSIEPTKSPLSALLATMVPVCHTKLKREGMVEKWVQKWGSARISSDCTQWEVLTEGKSLEEAMDVVKSYMNFCTEMLIPTKTIRVFSNNKPWIRKSLKTTLIKNELAFHSGNKQ